MIHGNCSEFHVFLFHHWTASLPSWPWCWRRPGLLIWCNAVVSNPRTGGRKSPRCHTRWTSSQGSTQTKHVILHTSYASMYPQNIKTSKHTTLPSLFFFSYIVMDHTTESLRTPWLAWCARCCRLVDFRHECDPKVLPFGLGTLQTTSPTGLANHPAYSAVEAFQDLWLNQLNHKQPQATTSRLIWAAEQKCVS